MKMKRVKVKNFRGYSNEVSIDISDLTALVGKNDIGKSTILEALDIFFNDGKGVVKIDKGDVNKQAAHDGDTEVVISICFEQLPATVVLDATNTTTLEDEYLVNVDGDLEIIKKYINGGTCKVYVKALHPSNPQCKDLLSKKDTELRTIIERQAIVCNDRTRNAEMRAAIWNHYSNSLELSATEIDVTKGDTKTIWDRLQSYLPLYCKRKRNPRIMQMLSI
jgi:predicted ATP-dependent endonuclease of OLD family